MEICDTVLIRDNSLIVKSINLIELMSAITDRINQNGAKINKFTLRENTLEDVFIHIDRENATAMMLLSIILKSIKEQLRNYWILLLTVSLAPLFVFIYYLIIESSEPQYNLLLLNNDKSIEYFEKEINFGETLIKYFKESNSDSIGIPLNIKISDDQINAINLLKTHKSDALIIIPEGFSEKVINSSNDIEIEFVGDLTNLNYMISAIWANEIISSFLAELIGIPKQYTFKETSLRNIRESR